MISNDPVAMRLDQELKRELATGERVLWQARPDPGRMKIVFIMWLFAIPWTAFSLAWTGIALGAYLSVFDTDQAHIGWWGWFFPLFGLPFIAVGFWMLSRPVVALLDARHSIHALTSERLLTLTSRKQRSVKSVSLAKLGPVTRKESADGWGSLSVETGSSTDSDGDRVTDRFEISAVPDVGRLERLINENRARNA
jgi:hypothetical protein